MQIDPIRLKPISVPGVQKTTETPATPEITGPHATGATPPADGLILSQQASEIRAAHEALAALPDTRAELISRLKAEIEAGAYQVHADNIARKLIP